MSIGRHVWPPDRRAVADQALTAGLVGATLLALGQPPALAGAAAAGTALLNGGLRALQGLVGDYADNAALGCLVLAGTGYLLAVDFTVWGLALGGAVGGWLLVDGVQHLRRGVARDEVVRAYAHDGGVATGFLRALGERLLEPFRL